MLEPWNDRSILSPPVHTVKYDYDIDLNTISYTCKSIVNILSKQSPLHQESSIFSRLLYKFDKKFRSDIGYRNFKKVNCALRRYLMLNLLKDVEQFAAALPTSEDNKLYLPTRQMLEYVLIRIVTFSKIMLRIIVCSKQAAVFYMDRVKRGESHWMCVMPYALLSRVWSLALVLLQHSCSWYKVLYSFLDRMQLKGMHFLPPNYKLPIDLEEWLDVKNINNFGRFKWSQKESVNIDSLDIHDDVDALENILQYVADINEKPKNLKKPTKLNPLNPKIKIHDLSSVAIKHYDQGEAVSRESYNRLLTSGTIEKKLNKEDNYFHVIDSITDRNSLRKFIKKEESFRNETSKRSLTNHLSFMQWHALKHSLSNLDSSTVNSVKLQKKFQKVWKEKCLDMLE